MFNDKFTDTAERVTETAIKIIAHLARFVVNKQLTKKGAARLAWDLAIALRNEALERGERIRKVLSRKPPQ